MSKPVTDPRTERDRLQDEFGALVNLVNGIDFDVEDDVEMAVLYGRLKATLRKTIQEWILAYPSPGPGLHGPALMDRTWADLERLCGVKTRE